MLRGAGTELEGEPFPALFSAIDQDVVNEYLRSLAGTTEDRSSFTEASCTLSDGDERWIEVTGVNLLDAPEVGGLVLNLCDRTEHRRALEYAFTDPLTGLGNRRALDSDLKTSGPVVVVYLDLDHFKGLNDTYGHAAGDAVLAEVGRRLQNIFGVTRSIYRAGGEEFVVLFPAGNSVSPSSVRNLLWSPCAHRSVQAR